MDTLSQQAEGDGSLTDGQVNQVLDNFVQNYSFSGKRVLLIIPDGTRTAPIGVLFKGLYQRRAKKVAKIDIIIALGTHPMIIGNKWTPVRKVVDMAASLIKQERLCLAPLVDDKRFVGLFAGTPEGAWDEARNLSSQIHITFGINLQTGPTLSANSMLPYLKRTSYGRINASQLIRLVGL